MTHRPHPRQTAFLLLDDVREVLFGGAARGGKSDALLMAAAQYLHVPGYAALLLRRTFQDLKQSEGLIPRSLEWWGRTAARWNAQDKQWTFPCPGGGTSLVRFGYCSRVADVYQYQGSAYHYVGWDELTQFEEEQYRYLFSRQSPPAAGPLAAVPLRMRAASNPGGVGHEWVKKRFVAADTREPGAVYLPSRVADNPTVDRRRYEQSLAYLDPMTRDQLLAGDWDAFEGGRFDRRWFRGFVRKGDHIFLDGRRVEGKLTIFVIVDTAASTKASADRTVVTVWGSTPCNQLLWLDCVAGRWEVPDILPLILRVAAAWKTTTVWIESVAAHSGTSVFQSARREKLAAVPFVPDGDKLNNAYDAITLAATGRIWVPEPRPPWVEDALGELARFTGDPAKDAHDDVVDTVAQAARVHLGKAVMGGVGMPWVKRG